MKKENFGCNILQYVYCKKYFRFTKNEKKIIGIVKSEKKAYFSSTCLFFLCLKIP